MLILPCLAFTHNDMIYECMFVNVLKNLLGKIYLLLVIVEIKSRVPKAN